MLTVLCIPYGAAGYVALQSHRVRRVQIAGWAGGELPRGQPAGRVPRGLFVSTIIGYLPYPAINNNSFIFCYQ